MINISKNEIKEFCNSNELSAKITDIKFDVEFYRKKVLDICKSIPPIGKDSQAKYKALGLQYKDEDDKYYDSVPSIRYINENHKSIIETYPCTDWSNWNDLGEELFSLAEPIYNLGYKLSRTRILLAESHYTSVRHIDYDWRYHVPLQTNKECFLEYDNEKIYLPADGYAYLINAGFMHKFNNRGITNRYHYCGILNQPCKGDGIKLLQLQS
tara:strand:- start:300 stop:935 length:636 start_codon:yes stop_codon:yes gene_type:complete